MQDAEVIGVGEGMQSFLNPSGTAEARAHADAYRALDRAIRRARCPKCKQRNPGVMVRFLAGFVVAIVLAMAVGIVAGFYPTWSDMDMAESDRAVCRWLLPLLFGGVLLFAIPIELAKRWPRDSRVRWLPGTELDR
jgi:hypothetical protein